MLLTCCKWGKKENIQKPCPLAANTLGAFLMGWVHLLFVFGSGETPISVMAPVIGNWGFQKSGDMTQAST